MIPRGAYVLWRGRTLPVVASVCQNNIPHVCVMVAPKIPLLIPEALAELAPARTAPMLVCKDGRLI